MVVLIIGVLAAIAMPMYNAALEKSRRAEALITGRSIVGAMERNYMMCSNSKACMAENFWDSLDVENSFSGGCSSGSSSVCRTQYFSYGVNTGSSIDHVTIYRTNSTGYDYIIDIYTNYATGVRGVSGGGTVPLRSSTTCYAYTSLGKKLCNNTTRALL